MFTEEVDEHQAYSRVLGVTTELPLPLTTRQAAAFTVVLERLWRETER